MFSIVLMLLLMFKFIDLFEHITYKVFKYLMPEVEMIMLSITFLSSTALFIEFWQDSIPIKSYYNLRLYYLVPEYPHPSFYKLFINFIDNKQN